jgi:hypothetical protein
MSTDFRLSLSLGMVGLSSGLIQRHSFDAARLSTCEIVDISRLIVAAFAP